MDFMAAGIALEKKGMPRVKRAQIEMNEAHVVHTKVLEVLKECDEVMTVITKNAEFFPEVELDEGIYSGHMMNGMPCGYGSLLARDGITWNV